MLYEYGWTNVKELSAECGVSGCAMYGTLRALCKAGGVMRRRCSNGAYEYNITVLGGLSVYTMTCICDLWKIRIWSNNDTTN